MKMLLKFSVTIGFALAFSSPLAAEEAESKEQILAVCFWEKDPEAALTILNSQTQEEFEAAFERAGEACNATDGPYSMGRLFKALDAARPAAEAAASQEASE